MGRIWPVGHSLVTTVLNSCLQIVLSGLKSENGGDDKEGAEESYLEITTDNEMCHTLHT